MQKDTSHLSTCYTAQKAMLYLKAFNIISCITLLLCKSNPPSWPKWITFTCSKTKVNSKFKTILITKPNSRTKTRKTHLLICYNYGLRITEYTRLGSGLVFRHLHFWGNSDTLYAGDHWEPAACGRIVPSRSSLPWRWGRGPGASAPLICFFCHPLVAVSGLLMIKKQIE